MAKPTSQCHCVDKYFTTPCRPTLDLAAALYDVRIPTSRITYAKLRLVFKGQVPNIQLLFTVLSMQQLAESLNYLIRLSPHLKSFPIGLLQKTNRQAKYTRYTNHGEPDRRHAVGFPRSPQLDMSGTSMLHISWSRYNVHQVLILRTILITVASPFSISCQYAFLHPLFSALRDSSVQLYS